MAKKGNRVQVILECTEQKTTDVPGTSRYISTKNKKNNPERLELKPSRRGLYASQELLAWPWRDQRLLRLFFPAPGQEQQMRAFIEPELRSLSPDPENGDIARAALLSHQKSAVEW